MTPTAMSCRPGRLEESEAELETALREATATPDGFMWIDLSSPSREEFETITRRLRLEGLDFDELLRHRPRHAVDRVGDMRVFAFKSLQRDHSKDDAQLATKQLVLCVTDRLVLTIHDGADGLFDEVRHHIRSDTA